MPSPGKRNTVRVKLNKQIYRLAAVKKAIEAYRHLAQFSLKQDARYYQVTLDHIAPTVKDILKDEFTNYILALNKNVR